MGLWDVVSNSANNLDEANARLLEQNRQFALEDRAFNAMREDTAYQRSVADLKAAGLNPWLAVSNPASSQPVSNVAGSNIEAQKIRQGYYQLFQKTMNDAINTTIKGTNSAYDAVYKIGRLALPIAQLF